MLYIYTCVIHTVCLWSRLYISERGKLYHTFSMFMIQMLSIRKRENVSYLQYVYLLACVYQKEGNCIIPTVCLWSRFCVSERGSCIIPTLCLCSRLCVSKRGNLYYTHSMFMIHILCVRKRELYHIYSMFMFLILCIRKHQK